MDEATQLIFERNPVLCGHFHKALDKVLRELSSRSTIFVLGDFNTKSGSLDDLHPRFVGNYGCSVTNVIGKVLIDLTYKHKLCIANTSSTSMLTQVSGQHQQNLKKKSHKNLN